VASAIGAKSEIRFALCDDEASNHAEIDVNGEPQLLPLCADCFADVEQDSKRQSADAVLVSLSEDDEY
jgi:hypothetical protein